MERNNDMPRSAVNEVNAESNGLQEQAPDDNGLENIVSPSEEAEEKTITPKEDKEMRPVGAKPKPTTENAEASAPAEGRSNIDFLLDVPLGVSVELGRTKIVVRDMLQLGPGSVLELDKMIGEPLDLLVNDKLIARGEVVVFDENFGIRITDIIKPEDRIRSLR
jgi:flagellar motor switch protein FliN/FliY